MRACWLESWGVCSREERVAARSAVWGGSSESDEEEESSSAVGDG